ncbi:hypothetical protein D3C76_395330 [compost metagenome]
MRRLFGDHQGGGTGIAGRYLRHDRSISDTKTGDAMHAQLVIHNVHGTVAHAAGTDRVEDGGADLASGLEQFFLALQRWARQIFLGLESGEGRGLDDAPGKANGIGSNPQVLRSTEVIGVDQRRAVHVGAADVDAPAAGRAQVAHRGSKGRELMQRLTEAFQ